MARELELKFALAPTEEARLRGAAALRRRFALAAEAPRALFRHARGELAARKMALRLRGLAGAGSQTLKTGGREPGGVHDRSEWEFDRRDASIDLSLFAETPLAKLDDAANLHARLAETSASECERTRGSSSRRRALAWKSCSIAATSPRAGARAGPRSRDRSLEGDAGAIFDRGDRSSR
jgi:hypothetical protein